MDTLNFMLKNGKDISFTPKEADIVIKYYRIMLSMLDEIAKNPKMVPALQQALYEAIREVEHAKSETEENTEEKNPNETEWKPFMEKN